MTIAVINSLDGTETEWSYNAANEKIVNIAEFEAIEGKTYVFDKHISVYTTRDNCNSIVEEAVKAVRDIERRDYERALKAHIDQWQKYWDSSDIVIAGDEFAQGAIRFCMYHLLIAASRNDDRVSIGAKALSGELYRGLVFWNTDIYMLPFFIHTQPELARNLVMYRYHTLDGARSKAKSMGYKGAMYPWESALSGKEECERWIAWPYHQQHITCDVAYAVMQYWWLTADEEFMVNYGSEIMLETARFWASRVEKKGSWYEINDVGGPDEYHCRTNNNCFINGLVKYLMRCSYDIAQRIRQKHSDRWQRFVEDLGYSDEEVDTWPEIADKIKINYDPQTKLYEQCDGFFKLSPELDKKGHHSHLTQTVKQPDVLLYLLLVEEEISKDVLKANWEYYDPRTVHGSSLSPGVHGWLAARLGQSPEGI